VIWLLRNAEFPRESIYSKQIGHSKYLGMNFFLRSTDMLSLDSLFELLPSRSPASTVLVITEILVGLEFLGSFGYS